jgi:HAD superfamily hydrolase (TIGR01459 family)
MADLPLVLDGIADLASRYDAFILDIWGVLHDGINPYPGVVDALERLAAAGKIVGLLSNAPMRAHVVARRVEQIGVPRHLFRHVMSSGEEVWQALHDRTEDFYAALGHDCLWLGPDRHGGMVEGLGLRMVEAPEAASFILNTGPDELDDAATELQPLLRRAAALGVPMVCANADLHVMQGGDQIVCAGQLARVYESLGGVVRWHGKPFPSVYKSCLAQLGIADLRRILAIGDSLRTDIAGAAGMGLDSVLVVGGILAGQLGYEPGGEIDPAALEARFSEGARPTYAIGQLRW